MGVHDPSGVTEPTSIQPVRITDPADERLADYRQLRDPAARRRIEGDELFIAEGPLAIERLLESSHPVRSLLLSEDKYERMAPRLGQLVTPPVVFVTSRPLLGEIVGFDLHRGAIAAAGRLPLPSLGELLRGARRVAVLEGLNDPENLGAVARSARALGVDALVLDPTCIDPYARRTVRVSMGEILLLPFTRVAAGEWPAGALAAIGDAGFETWALTPAADADDIWELPVPERLALVLGAEGPGLSGPVMAGAGRRVRIPISPEVDSLNVGAAAAVAFAIAARPAG